MFETGGFFIMKYILSCVILIFTGWVISYFFKKKRFKEIDKIEEWKLSIMNRPVLDELSKVKQLNMTGETEEMFEKWRNEWDEIVTVQLPDVEEMLFDAEEYIEKYRFSRSKAVQKEIGIKLNGIEKNIQSILDELNELVGSEEKNRTEVTELRTVYRTVKKQILAHRHYYGVAAEQLEVLLNDVEEQFSFYEEATVNGNYLLAREHVLKLKADLQDIEYKMKRIPDLLIECNSSIPDQLAEIKEGYNEMLEKGYVLDHIDFSKELEEMEKTIDIYKELLGKAEIQEVEKGLLEMKDNISVLYDSFEKEVDARHFIYSNREQTDEQLSSVLYDNDKLKAEITVTKSSYHVPEADIKLQKTLEKQLFVLQNQYENLQARLEQTEFAYSIQADQLKEIISLITAVKEEQDVLTQKIRDLRKDELEAREQLKVLQIKINKTLKWIKSYNLPGIPESFGKLVNDARESISQVNIKLEETPLDMASVKIFLEEAEIAVNAFAEMTKELIEQMLLAEKVIQYTNRYRSSYPFVQAALQEAETQFRKYEYHAALEEAAAALEQIEPGSLKAMRIQLNFEEEIE